MEEQLAAALIARDPDVFETLLAPEFILRGVPDVPRATWIANALKLCWGDRYELSDFRVVRTEPPLAVVTLVLTTDRDPVTCDRAVVRSLLTDVWRRDESGWRLTLRHSGPAGGVLESQFAREAAPPPLVEASAELSLVSTGGNAETQTLGLGASITWRPRPWTTQAQTSLVRSEASGVETARSFVASVRQSRAVATRLDLFARFEYLVDEFAGIDERITIDAGLGYRAVSTPAHRLRLDFGFGYSHEGRLADGDLSSALATLGAVYAWTLHRQTSLDNASQFTASLDRGDDWRFRNTLAATAGLTRMLSIRVSHEVKYVNAPVPGFERTDRILSAALVAKF